jgi:hypothetical protein
MTRKQTKIELYFLGLRDAKFPDAKQKSWDRHDEKGFTTVPRTLPLVATLIRHLTKRGDASRVYLDLWGRALYDTAFIVVNDEEELADSCGYDGTRKIRTWRERADVLVNLGFIEIAPKGKRKFGYIFLVHPHDVVQRLRKAKKVPDWWWSLFETRLAEIRATLRPEAQE